MNIDPYVGMAVGMTVGVLGGTLLANLLIIWLTHRKQRRGSNS